MKLNKSVIQSLKFLAFLAVGILLLWLAFRNVNFRSLWEGLEKANYFWVIFSLLFALLAYLSRARRWMILIHPLGYHPLFKNTFYALMSGYLANLALPRIGEVTRCVVLGKKEKIPVDKLFGTVVIERTIDFLTLLLITFALIFASGKLIRQFLNDSILKPFQEKVLSPFGMTWIFWIILAAMGIIALAVMIKYKKSLREIRLFAKIFDIARGILDGFKTIISLDRKWEFIFHTIFIWLNYALMTWFVVFSLRSTSDISFWSSIFILVIGGLAMSAPVQSGLGVFHYTVSRGLAVVHGIKLEDGLVYALLAHESQLIFVLILGIFSFFALYGFHHHKDDGPGLLSKKEMP